jgi:hypothetical protein
VFGVFGQDLQDLGEARRRSAHAVQAVEAPPGRDAHAAARLALVSGEGHEQDHGALEEVAVVMLAGAPRCEDHRRRRVGQLPGEALDQPGRQPGDRRRLLRRVVRQLLPQPLEDRTHRDLLAIG